MDNAKREGVKYLVIQITIIVLLLFAIAFWLQPFIVNNVQIGVNHYIITGMEIAFGFSKSVPMPGPTETTITIEDQKSITVLVGYISFLCVLGTQIILFILRLNKKINIKIYRIINLICGGLILFSTISCLCSGWFFSIANDIPEGIFMQSGSITTSILFLAILFAIFLNSIDPLLKKKEK